MAIVRVLLVTLLSIEFVVFRIQGCDEGPPPCSAPQPPVEPPKNEPPCNKPPETPPKNEPPCGNKPPATPPPPPKSEPCTNQPPKTSGPAQPSTPGSPQVSAGQDANANVDLGILEDADNVTINGPVCIIVNVDNDAHNDMAVNAPKGNGQNTPATPGTPPTCHTPAPSPSIISSKPLNDKAILGE